MGIVHILERGGDDYHDYKNALKMAKKGIDMLCDLTEEMESEYSERGRSRSRYREDDMEDVEERRYRSRGKM